MKSANRLEKDLLTKFIDAAQKVMPGIKMRYAEKYQYDDDIYLRVGLSLPHEIDADSPDIEKIQKIASSIPIHPKYQLSISFTTPSEPDNELALDFLAEQYLADQSWKKRFRPKHFFSEVFTRQWVVRGTWHVSLFGIICWLLGVAIVFYQDPSTLLLFSRWSIERHFLTDYFAVANEKSDQPASLQLHAKGKELEEALLRYAKQLNEMKTDENRVNYENAIMHVLRLQDLIKADPFAGEKDK